MISRLKSLPAHKVLWAQGLTMGMGTILNGAVATPEGQKIILPVGCAFLVVSVLIGLMAFAASKGWRFRLIAVAFAAVSSFQAADILAKLAKL